MNDHASAAGMDRTARFTDPLQRGRSVRGQLELDKLITAEYTLDQVAEAYEDMHAGKNIRGVIVFDD